MAGQLSLDDLLRVARAQSCLPVGRACPVVVALFIEPTGPYAQRAGVEGWGPDRDARTYGGPHPVVAHPPCAAWGRYAGTRGPPVGEDEGCFAAALAAVKRYGGVLEHPADTKAFAAFRLPKPPREGGWLPFTLRGARAPAWVAHVEQGHYGHEANKPTWLLYVGNRPPPELRWGPSGVPRRPGSSPRRGNVERMSKRQRALTPPAFADLLVRMARNSLAGGTMPR
jgi:hypothetical protein